MADLDPSPTQPAQVDVNPFTSPAPPPAPTVGAPPTPPAPSFDTAALTRTIQEGFAQAAARMPAQAPPPPPPLPPDPMRNVLAPYIAPIVQHQDLQNRAMADQMNFYTAHRDISPDEHRAVESKFSELMMSGRPVPREDILAWHRGMNLDNYVDRSIQSRLDAIARAEQAQALGPGISRGAYGGPVKNARDASDEELANWNRGRLF